MSWSKITGTAFKMVALVLLTVSLAACGFQLRGRASLPFETLFVEGGSPALVADLNRAIGIGSRTRLLPSAAGAQAVLQISGESREKRILSLSGVGRVREYLLIYRVEFRLRDSRSRDLLPLQTIELRRDMTYDDTLVLAKESEEVLLYQDMQQDVTAQILRRMNAAKLPPPIAPED
ncbi:MAG: LPS assembly lipoprotein LptE [Sulfuricellaceae bacterium]